MFRCNNNLSFVAVIFQKNNQHVSIINLLDEKFLFWYHRFYKGFSSCKFVLQKHEQDVDRFLSNEKNEYKLRKYVTENGVILSSINQRDILNLINYFPNI